MINDSDKMISILRVYEHEPRCFVVMASLKWTRYDSCAYVLASDRKTSTRARRTKVNCLFLAYLRATVTSVSSSVRPSVPLSVICNIIMFCFSQSGPRHT